MIVKDPDLLSSFRGPGKCEICQAQHSWREVHHVLSRGSGGSDVRLNCLSICPTMSVYGEQCHYRLHYSGQTKAGRRMTREDLFFIIAQREGVSADEVETKLYELRNHKKHLPLPEHLAALLSPTAQLGPAKRRKRAKSRVKRKIPSRKQLRPRPS